MSATLLVIHLIITLAMIVLVLLQRSEGGALGIGGGGGNMFSSRGVGNALTKMTTILAFVFFLTSIGLTVLGSISGRDSILEGYVPTEIDEQTAPAPLMPEIDSPVGSSGTQSDIPLPPVSE